MKRIRIVFARVLRVTPFTLLCACAFALCALVMLDASSSPLAFTGNARTVVMVLLFLPATSSFELTKETDMFTGLVVGGVLGVVLCYTYVASSLGASAAFSGTTLSIVLLGAIFWCLWCLCYLAFFLIGNLIRGVYHKRWPPRYRMLS